jgi:hypothetical protein
MLAAAITTPMTNAANAGKQQQFMKNMKKPGHDSLLQQDGVTSRKFHNSELASSTNSELVSWFRR